VADAVIKATLSSRDIQALLCTRGVTVSHEAIRTSY